MPVQPGALEYVPDERGYLTIVNCAGQVVKGRRAEKEDYQAGRVYSGYSPHWAHCSGQKHMRKRVEPAKHPHVLASKDTREKQMFRMYERGSAPPPSVPITQQQLRFL